MESILERSSIRGPSHCKYDGKFYAYKGLTDPAPEKQSRISHEESDPNPRPNDQLPFSSFTLSMRRWFMPSASSLGRSMVVISMNGCLEPSIILTSSSE